MIWVSDPGHAWLKVALDEAKRLAPGLEVSGYSYIGGGCIFLEEDCDAPAFFAAAKWYPGVLYR